MSSEFRNTSDGILICLKRCVPSINDVIIIIVDLHARTITLLLSHRHSHLRIKLKRIPQIIIHQLSFKFKWISTICGYCFLF